MRGGAGLLGLALVCALGSAAGFAAPGACPPRGIALDSARAPPRAARAGRGAGAFGGGVLGLYASGAGGGEGGRAVDRGGKGARKGLRMKAAALVLAAASLLGTPRMASAAGGGMRGLATVAAQTQSVADALPDDELEVGGAGVEDEVNFNEYEVDQEEGEERVEEEAPKVVVQQEEDDSNVITLTAKEKCIAGAFLGVAVGLPTILCSVRSSSEHWD